MCFPLSVYASVPAAACLCGRLYMLAVLQAAVRQRPPYLQTGGRDDRQRAGQHSATVSAARPAGQVGE